MNKVDVWYESKGRYVTKNLSANRITLDFIRKNMVETGMAEAILHKYYRSVKK